jgi:colanic acid/amylovoran biosynthesis glycosyltransferase
MPMTTSIHEHGARGLIICVVHPLESAYSETFIRQHIERLSAHSVYGGPLPTWSSNGTPLIRQMLLSKGMGFLATRFLNLPPEYFSRRAFVRYLRRNAIDVVLAEYGPTGVEVRKCCHAAGVPLVVHFHGYDAHSIPVLEEHCDGYREMFATSAAVIAVSRTMAEQLLTLGVPNEKLFVNSCGVDVDVFSGGRPALAKPIFLAVGRFVDKKAPHLTLLAFAKVVEDFPEARLTMVGEGPLLDCCKQLVAALGITESVEFTGAVCHERVQSLMAGARAFVQHSVRTTYGDSEGTPVAVLEASAAGLPVVSTKHAGIQDAILHRRTGFLVAERDVNAMAHYMLRLAYDPGLAASMGAAGRQFISENYSAEKSIGQLYGILQKAVTDGRRQISDSRALRPKLAQSRLEPSSR